MLITRRAISRRLATLAARLGDSSDALTAKGGTEASLSRLERAADVVTTELADARVSRSRLEQAFGTVSQGVVVCDEQGDVVFHNEQALKILGDAPTEALAREAVVQHLQAAAQGRAESQTLELYGPPRMAVVVKAAPLPGGAAVVTIEDVSERRRVDAVRTDFVANISHELKTPVGALALLAEALADEDDPAAVTRMAARLVEESHRVARTIDELMELSCIELGESPVWDEVDAVQLARDAMARVAAVAEQRRIDVSLLDPPTGVRLAGDRRQLVSALGNLVENAVNYSEQGSSVQLRVRVEGPWAELMVADHGVGIPAAEHDRIFERFYRVDRARSRDTGGTGLGLSIVRHVANNHGGAVLVSSQEGEGSTFVLRLPLAPSNEDADVPAERAAR